MHGALAIVTLEIANGSAPAGIRHWANDFKAIVSTVLMFM